MKRLIVVALGIVMGLSGAAGGALAQTGPVVYDEAIGESGTCTVSGPPGERTIMCSDLRPGNGVAVINAGAEAEAAPVAMDEAPAPAAEASPEEAAPVEPAPETAAAPEASERAVATATDQDADNYADELEPGVGLDPTNPDTDGDGVADGDEPNIYGTDPLVWDTDGDGVSDGEELFGIYTDPLVWEEFGAEGAG